MITLETKIKLSHYYVYIHKKATSGEIFYVGKGKNNRCTSVKGRSKHWRNIHNKHVVICEIVANSLMESEAFLLEKKLIRKFGRLDLGEGTLVNLTDGGEGVSNWNITEKRREQIRVSSTGRKHTEATKEFLRTINTGRIISPETRDKISKSRMGKKWTPEIRELTIQGRKSSYKAVMCIETGEVYESTVAASKAIGGDNSLISKVCRGVRPAYRGLHWKFVKDLESSDS